MVVLLLVARFKTSVLFTFPDALGALGCFYLLKQCVIYMTEDYYQRIRKQFSDPFSSS